MTSGALAIRRLVISGIASLVFLAGCGGGSYQSINNQSPNPTPTITTILPNGKFAGGAAFTLTISGTNFVAASMVTFGGSAPATTFVNSTLLTAAIPAASLVSSGTLAVTVTNPAPGGGTSNSVNFTIAISVNPVPTIRYLIPSCVPAGEQFMNSGNIPLQVGGANFVDSSVLRWNGTDRPTLGVIMQFGLLNAQISASDIAAAGTAAVTVFNPGPGGGISNSLPFTITPGAVEPQSIAVDPTGKFAYVANADSCAGAVYISTYTINPTTGALTSSGPPLSAQDDGTAFVTVDPFGKFAYVVNGGDGINSSGSVVTYSINGTTGALTSGAISGDCDSDACHPSSMFVHPSGKFAYVTYGANEPNSIAMYSIDATTGALTSIGTIAVEGNASSVAVDPTGKFAYVTTDLKFDGTGIESVSMYAIDATTGVLASTGTIATGTKPASVTVDPSGKFAYVANSNSNDVSMYTINATTGALTSIGTIAAGTKPASVTVDPSGKFAYVANSNSNDVSMYTINGTTGALTPIGMIDAGMNPSSIAVHPSGKFAYVTNFNSNDVSMYSIDAATGELTLIGTIGT